MVANLAEARSHKVPPDVFLHHYSAIRTATNEHEDAAAALARAKKAAKAAGIDLNALKLLQQFAKLDDDEAALRLKNFRSYVAFAELPLGTQLDMWSQPKPPKTSRPALDEVHRQTALQEGKSAGANGFPRDANPHPAGEPSHVGWDRGWNLGHKDFMSAQAKIAREMGPPSGGKTGGRRAGGRSRGTTGDGGASSARGAPN